MINIVPSTDEEILEAIQILILALLLLKRLELHTSIIMRTTENATSVALKNLMTAQLVLKFTNWLNLQEMRIAQKDTKRSSINTTVRTTTEML